MNRRDVQPRTLTRWSLRPRRKPRKKLLLPQLEPLENRQLLSTVDWISPTSGSWDLGSNWSGGNVPGPDDDAVVDVPGVTVTISSNDESVNSITADDPLVISGGGLKVAADSTIGGGLTMTGGSLTAKGSGVSFLVTGITTISGASLYAQSGARLTLSQLTSYTEPSEESTSTLQASGAGSVLSLPALTSIAVTAGYSTTNVQALSGADVELPLVTQLSGLVNVESENASSVINLSDCRGFESHHNQRRRCDARRHRHPGHRTVDLPHQRQPDNHGRLVHVRRPDRHRRLKPVRGYECQPDPDGRCQLFHS
jgi:hypothetical protein